MHKDGFLLMGKVTGTHGVKGTLKVQSYAASPAIFGSGGRLLVRKADGSEKIRRINWAQPHGRGLLVSLAEINDLDQAATFKGAEIFVERAVLPELEDGAHYWCDLIGLAVFAIDGRCLGRIQSIIETGSNDVYVVRDGKRETLVPALRAVVKTIDLENKTMRVDLPEGL